MNNYGQLNNVGPKRVWHADGDGTVTPTPAATTAATTAAATTSTGMCTCTKKRIACVAAGVLIGVVATLLFKKGAKAA